MHQQQYKPETDEQVEQQTLVAQQRHSKVRRRGRRICHGQLAFCVKIAARLSVCTSVQFAFCRRGCASGLSFSMTTKRIFHWSNVCCQFCACVVCSHWLSSVSS